MLHALAISVPHLNGYAIRSRYVVATQRRCGIARPVVVTSPFYPGLAAARDEQVVDEVPHLRVPHPVDTEGGSFGDRVARRLYRARHAGPLVRAVRLAKRVRRRLGSAAAARAKGARAATAPARRLDGPRTLVERPLFAAARLGLRIADRMAVADRAIEALASLEEWLLMRRFARHLADHARRLEVDLIHAHSPYRTALPAIAAARAVGRPVVYELRGLWEESAVASGFFRAGDRRYRAWRRKEERALAAADVVICIGEELRREVVGRGIPQDRVFVVPNAVDADAFLAVGGEVPPAAVAAAGESLVGITFGYVGSLRRLEGVDELVRGVAELVRRGREVSLLVVGGGELAPLRELAEELGLGGRAVFTGAVPHDDVAAYYRQIDVFVISRPDLPVARLVTPLKPLEAMALGLPLVVPDLPALRELVEDDVTGLLYRPGDVAHLADIGERLIDDPGLRARLARAGQRWVAQERTWSQVLRPVPEIYRAALRFAASAARPGEW